MKFLSHITSKSRSKADTDNDNNRTSRTAYEGSARHEHESRVAKARIDFRCNPTASYSQALLRMLLCYVCPHSQDDTFVPCEESMTDAGCMLCDVRDLSLCALVNKQWSEAATNVLYHNVRIDSVHYCERETELALKRKRRSTSGRDGVFRSPPQERLQLLSRTIRENDVLAGKVQYLKLPYMIREASVAVLARTVAALPNLRYVDLPNDSYSDGSLYTTLRQELQSRCPQLRYMRYKSGSEGSFSMLLQLNPWPELETIELFRLALEASTVVEVLASLGSIQDVTLADTYLLDDSIFDRSHTNTPFPALSRLTLQDLPSISVEGLVTYLSQPEPKNTLTYLTLTRTGYPLQDLHRILSAAPCLISLHITASVSRAHPFTQIPYLASDSLRLLHFEISDSDSSPGGVPSPSESYYAYLSSSILNGSLPSLMQLYGLSATLQNLLQPAPSLKFSGNRSGAIPASLKPGISQPLHLHTKSMSEMEWESTLLLPQSTGRGRDSVVEKRSESMYNVAPLSPQYRYQGRQSVIVGNGFGGFLAVPNEDPPQSSPRFKNKTKDIDAWMG